MNRWFYRVCEFMNRDEVADRDVMALVVAVFAVMGSDPSKSGDGR